MRLNQPGLHRIEVGFPHARSTFDVEAFRTVITSHVDGGPLPDGGPLTFTAVTEPPGYEDHIVWLAATKFGSAEPTLGSGATFTTTFLDTFGYSPTDDLWFMWKGVKANWSRVGQDAVCDNGVLEPPEECDSDATPCVCPPNQAAFCIPGECICDCIGD